MHDNDNRFRDALVRIAAIANEAVGDSDAASNGGHQGDHAHDEVRVCTPKVLPQHLLVKAAETAVRINPMNRPVFGPLAEAAPGFVPDRMRVAVVTSKYWGPKPRRLTVSFMETTEAALRAKILSHMNAWTRTGGIQFVETQGIGEVRISRGPGGYWSYVGTDIRLIPPEEQTMNLQGFTMRTDESEFRRVVRHEAGHTLGMPHEHMRRALVELIDREKAYEYFRRTQRWDRETVDEQVLTPLDERSLMGTPADQTSIMCYQLPGSITRNGRPIPGGDDINETDYAFVGQIYPQPASADERAVTCDDEPLVALARL